MVDKYNTATVKLVSADFIKQYSLEKWNAFSGGNRHKGIVSVAGWAETEGDGKSKQRPKALFDMPTKQFETDKSFQRILDNIYRTKDYRLVYFNT